MRSLARSAAPLAICAALAAPVTAGPLAPTKPSQLVTAYGRSIAADCPGAPPGAGIRLVDRIANADGSNVPFAIPEKSVLVVQSFDFVLQAGGDPNAYENVAIVAVDPAIPLSGGNSGALAGAGALADSAGAAMGSVAIPSGLVVKPPAALCFQVDVDATAIVVVHGFFAKDK